MAKDQFKAAGPETKGLRVVSRPPTFRRAGFTFSSEARTIPLSEVSQDQVDLLKGESNLVVSEVDIEPAAETKGETKPTKK